MEARPTRFRDISYQPTDARIQKVNIHIPRIKYLGLGLEYEA